MCFGNTQQTSTQTSTPPAWLTSAAQSNINNATNLQKTGFTPYTGSQVASFSPQQAASFGMGTNIANATGGNIQPGADALSTALGNAQGGAPYSSIAANMSPYMNQYVNLALQPQLAAAANSYMLQSQANQGAATSAGAFGDPRANLLQSNLGLNYGLENAGLVGNAYNAAFNTAIGAGAQDVSNKLNAWGLGQNALLGASAAAFNQGTGATNLQNTLGAQQTAQSQAQLNAQYNQWLMAQQYPFQTQALSNATLAAAQAGAPQTTTLSQPNNAGYGLLGSVVGGAGSAAGGYFQGQGAAAGGQALASALPSILAAAAAEGGDVEEDQPVLVGEHGPELIVPKTASNVIPFHKVQKAIANKKGVRQTPGPAMQFGLAA
jgi:hypothetical protein